MLDRILSRYEAEYIYNWLIEARRTENDMIAQHTLSRWQVLFGAITTRRRDCLFFPRRYQLDWHPREQTHYEALVLDHGPDHPQSIFRDLFAPEEEFMEGTLTPEGYMTSEWDGSPYDATKYP